MVIFNVHGKLWQRKWFLNMDGLQGNFQVLPSFSKNCISLLSSRLFYRQDKHMLHPSTEADNL